METNKPLISVIIPVYKVEEYLPACIDSILAQTYQNLEIILIDDGSPDNCGKICDGYAEKDSRIKVIHKENGGVSSARNAGLDAASGEYVGFVDSDDIIAPTMYEELYGELLRTDSDVSVCRFARFFDGQEKENFSSIKKTSSDLLVLDSTEALSDLLRGTHFYGSLWDKLFKANLVKNARLREDIFVAEDFLFSVEALLKAKRVCFSDTPLYFYRMRETSIMHTIYSEKHLTMYDAMVAAEDLFQKYGVYEALNDEINASAITFHVKIMRCLSQNRSLRKKYARRSVSELKSRFNKRSAALLFPSVKKHAMILRFSATLYFVIQKILRK